MNQNQLNYLFKNFSLIYDFNDFSTIDFGNIKNSDSRIIIKEGEKNLAINPVLTKWNNTEIPLLFNSTKKSEIISQEDGKVIINYDILSAAFYILSGKQELEENQTDRYGRFEFKKSLQFNHNFTEVPIVNYYFDILKTAIERAYGIKIKLKHTFTTCLTHDIDEVNSAWKHRIRKQLEQKNILKASFYFIKHLTKPFYPWRNIFNIIETEKQLGVNSTFFFLTNDKKIDQIKNADYKINSPYITHQMETISDKNSEIAIHGSYKTHLESNNLKKDIDILSREVKGNRFHFLQWDMKFSPTVIDNNNLEYDSTLGFQEQVGFRNGICNPFYLFNFETQKAYDFIEIPLIVMDCSLAFKNYMNTSPNKVDETLHPLIKEVKKFEGVLTINWHNTFISDYLYSDWKDVYFGIIKQCKLQGSTFETCLKITNKYKS